MVTSRLSSARHPLVASGLVALVAMLAGAPPIAAASGFALVVGAAAIGPRQSGTQRLRDRAASIRRARGAARDPDATAVIDAVRDPAFLLDARLVIVHQNRAATRAFGPSGEGLGARVKFRAPELREFLEAARREATRKVLRSYELAGRDRWFEVHAAPVRQPRVVDAAPTHWLLVFREQTEARREARIRADFIANASHELRTPLASLTAIIETLRGNARDDARARERFLVLMEEQAKRMSRLVDDLMSLSRLERRARLRPRERVDLARIAAHVVASASPSYEAEGVELAFERPDGARMAAGDPDELVQVVANLVENALRYGGSGGRVVVRVADTGDAVELSVRDRGPGIAAEHVPRLTERFYRVDVEASRASKGTGLGLAIVKHILARHGTQLRIDSRPGEGATFSFALPTIDRERPKTKA